MFFAMYIYFARFKNKGFPIQYQMLFTQYREIVEDFFCRELKRLKTYDDFDDFLKDLEERFDEVDDTVLSILESVMEFQSFCEEMNIWDKGGG